MADEEKKGTEEPKTSPEPTKSRGQRKKAKSAGGKGKKDGGMMTKVVATVFGAVVAPILVAVGINYFKNVTTPDKHDATQPEKPVVTTKKADDVLHMITPNLGEYFYTYGTDPVSGRDVRKDTVDPALFRYEEPDRIVVPGGKYAALLTTKEAYGDYILNFWYRWGEHSPEVPDWPRRACLILHITGSDGAAGGIYPQGITVRLGDGDAGNIRLGALPGTLHCMARVKESPDRLRREYLGPDAPEVRQESGDAVGWVGGIFRRGFPADVSYRPGAGIACDGLVAGSLGGGTLAGLVSDRSVVSVIGKGWHPDTDPTMKKVTPSYKPNEWNRVRIECIKGRLTIFVNGHRVNEITDLNLMRGRIAIASQGAQYEIGRIDLELNPPDKPPEKGEKGEKGRP